MNGTRENSIAINKSEFKKIGYQLIDSIAEFLDDIHNKPITTSKSPLELQNQLGGVFR